MYIMTRKLGGGMLSSPQSTTSARKGARLSSRILRRVVGIKWLIRSCGSLSLFPIIKVHNLVREIRQQQLL